MVGDGDGRRRTNEAAAVKLQLGAVLPCRDLGPLARATPHSGAGIDCGYISYCTSLIAHLLSDISYCTSPIGHLLLDYLDCGSGTGEIVHASLIGSLQVKGTGFGECGVQRGRAVGQCQGAQRGCAFEELYFAGG